MRANLKRANEDLEAKDKEISVLKAELDQMKETMNSEQSTALKEMSKNNSSALQTLKSEMEAKMKQAEEKHAQAMTELKKKLEAEMADKLEAAAKDKEVHSY